MRAYTLDHLGDRNLLRALTVLVARERATTAELLAHIAEVDARRLYAPAGYASMHAYCVGELRLSEDSAFRRIRAARTARQFPVLLEAVAEGRLSLTAVILLTPYLTRENVAGLIKAATHGTRAEIEAMLARRFPRTELMPLVEAAPAQPIGQLAPAPVEKGEPCPATTCGAQLAPAPVAAPTAKVVASAPERFALHVTISRTTHEKLRHAQALLSHRLPTSDLATTLDLALDALVEKLEKRKFAKTDKPRPPRRSTSANPHHIPAHVKRAVWERDGGQCTFVSATGHRCNAHKFLEFDHVEPVARGGQASVAGVRLRCRAHNQLEAERVFGAGFMSAKRAEVQARCSTTSYRDRNAAGGCVTNAMPNGTRRVAGAGKGPRCAEAAQQAPLASPDDHADLCHASEPSASAASRQDGRRRSPRRSRTLRSKNGCGRRSARSDRERGHRLRAFRTEACRGEPVTPACPRDGARHRCWWPTSRPRCATCRARRGCRRGGRRGAPFPRRAAQGRRHACAAGILMREPRTLER